MEFDRKLTHFMSSRSLRQVANQLISLQGLQPTKVKNIVWNFKFLKFESLFFDSLGSELIRFDPVAASFNLLYLCRELGRSLNAHSNKIKRIKRGLKDFQIRMLNLCDGSDQVKFKIGNESFFLTKPCKWCLFPQQSFLWGAFWLKGEFFSYYFQLWGSWPIFQYEIAQTLDN